MDEAPQEVNLLSFRGLAQEEQLSYLTQSSLKRFHELVDFIVTLLERLNLSWEVKIRKNEFPQNFKMLDEIAMQIRYQFGWNEETRKKLGYNPKNAFRWWREKIEDLGVFCFEFKLEPAELRGASLWHKSLPFILVNNEDTESSYGRIFTLLHEYIHLVSYEDGLACDFIGTQGSGHNPEPFANKLAARILVTFEEMKNRLISLNLFRYQDDWPDSVLDKIRKELIVSRDVVAIMLEEMSLARKNFYKEKRSNWKGRRTPYRKGRGRPTKKEQKLREIGYSLTKLISTGIKHSDFPLLDVSYILDIKVEKTEEFLRELSR